MGLLKKLFNWKKKTEDPVFEIEDWNEVVYDRSDLKINDTQQRKEYVKGCLEQIAEASKELEALQFEYNMVTSYLKDMEEIEALPEEEKEGLMVYARKIEELEERQSGYKTRANRMSDVKYHQIERMEEDVQEGYEKLAETEEYQELIKRDLKKLDGEKHAYLFRRNELHKLIEDTRSMTIVCTVAVIVCILLLMALQFGLQMNTRLGYLAVAAVGAIAITKIGRAHV